ncbi:hypothetical protein EYR41_010954 [Orbilia oligospora]|uniref:Uncharacterized protein n=1 Tax=Orbilia oligospora TaxID=2813651 RepID=A0A7C8PHY0_ORBOL|nr:hypothetical protein TWF751_008785 [Orbilia oligospora]TGJ63004.1 hypothetical protein EYR41_010954 [Orbilia oligospora]
MAIITDLPNELLEQIAIKLRTQYYDSNRFGNVLADFSLVCRAFYRVAFRYMHDEPDLSTAEKNLCTRKRVCEFLQLIQKNPGLGYVVRTLAIGPWDQTELSSKWGHNESFMKSYDFLKRTIEHKSLQEEDLHGLEDHPMSVLVAALFYLLPGLGYLHLVLRSSKRGGPLLTRWLLLAMDIAPLPFEEKIRGMELEYNEVDSSDVFPCRTTLGALLGLPGLEHVRFASEDAADSLLLTGINPTLSLSEGLEKLSLTPEPESELATVLSHAHSKAYKRFRSFDPFCKQRLLDLRSKSSITGLSFYNNPGSIFSIPDIIYASKELKEIDCFIGSRTRDTREDVQAIHRALLEHKNTLEYLSMSYYKGFDNRHNPNFQLDFSAFERLKTLQVSMLLLADIDAPQIVMGDVLPANLENLAVKIRYPSFATGGGCDWDEVVICLITKVAAMKDVKLHKLNSVDVRVINHPAKAPGSSKLKDARRMMDERGIEFSATTYDPSVGTVEL